MATPCQVEFLGILTYQLKPIEGEIDIPALISSIEGLIADNSKGARLDLGSTGGALKRDLESQIDNSLEMAVFVVVGSMLITFLVLIAMAAIASSTSGTLRVALLVALSIVWVAAIFTLYFSTSKPSLSSAATSILTRQLDVIDSQQATFINTALCNY